ncbi:MAG: class II glutamine amidotransferase, partial [Candidatus Margulisiibacteriota bacterium]
MCGIFGYIGNKNAVELVIEGLKRLEYRGYDSAGIAAINGGGKIHNVKCVGKIAELEHKVNKAPFTSHLCIGHTRWATHGEVTELNSHPHYDTAKNISLVHNGIIENFTELKEQLLLEGSMFHSETDTEVIPHLIAKFSKEQSFEKAVLETMRTLEGSYAFAVISTDHPDQLLAARKGSPLVVGLGEQKEFYIASDVSAIL